MGGTKTGIDGQRLFISLYGLRKSGKPGKRAAEVKVSTVEAGRQLHRILETLNGAREIPHIEIAQAQRKVEFGRNLALFQRPLQDLDCRRVVTRFLVQPGQIK